MSTIFQKNKNPRIMHSGSNKPFLDNKYFKSPLRDYNRLAIQTP